VSTTTGPTPGGWRLAVPGASAGTCAFPAAAPDRVDATARLRHRRLLALLLGGLAGFVGLLVVVAVLTRLGPPMTCRQLVCGVHAPVGSPVTSGTLFVDPRTGFSVRYWQASSVSTSGGVLQLDYENGAGFPDSSTPAGTYRGELQFAAMKTATSPDQVVADVANQIAPGAQLAYVVPNASVGYQAGYGAAYDYYPNSGAGNGQRFRLVVLAAVRAGLAVVVVADGPYVDFSQPALAGSIYHPAIADVFPALFADPSIDSVLWPGERAP
jgi:hypothetical protein